MKLGDHGEHRTRWLTAGVILPLLALAIAVGGGFIFLGVAVVALAGLWEFLALFHGPERKSARRLALVFGFLLLLTAWRLGMGPLAHLALFLVWTFNLIFLLRFSRNPGATAYPPFLVLPLSLCYLPLSLAPLLTFSRPELLLVIGAVVATDTGGFYAGHMLGGPKLWPAVSPKKTWAGCFGGLFLTLFFVLAVGLSTEFASVPRLVLLGLTLNIASQVGDFFESALKRSLKVKDSGRMLPGHGGLLDRVDGLLLAVPLYLALRGIIF